MRTIPKTAALAALLAAPAAAETSFIANPFHDGAQPFSKYGYAEWAGLVRELSDGDPNPEVCTGTVLPVPRTALQGIRDNVVQVAHHAAIYTPSDLPVAKAVQELGFNYSDPIPTIFAVAEVSTHNQLQLDEWKDKGLVYLGACTTPPCVPMCSSPVRSLAEMEGRHIRTAGSAVSVWGEEAAGIPVNVPSSEIYTRLERGTLDWASNAASDLVDRSPMEVAEYTTLLATGNYWAGPQWGYNAGFRASLTDAQREIPMQASARAMARIIIAYSQSAEGAPGDCEGGGRQRLRAGGGPAMLVETFRAEALEGIHDKASADYGIEDPEALIDDFRATMEKWQTLLADLDVTDEDALTELAMREIHADLEPATYGID